MDVQYNNVLEGTRQYFLGVPKPSQNDGGSGQTVWPVGAPPPEEGAPAQSGAPAPSSRPPSAAAAPPSTPGPTSVQPPPRPPSEPLEPEPHFIHKATVMREALEKRREQPETEDDDDGHEALSPPSHIIRKPSSAPSPAPAPAVPSPSPARPPSAATQPQPEAQPSEQQVQYRPPSHHRVQTPISRLPEHYAPGRPPDPYPTSRPPEPYSRYHSPYETSLIDNGRISHGPLGIPSQAPTSLPRQSPQQSYARISNSIPMQTAVRMRESPAHSPPSQRYQLPPTQPPPLNDRVPPLHHPVMAGLPSQRPSSVDNRASHVYPTTPLNRRETSPYARQPVHYDRHTPMAPRKYDPHTAYPGYRPSSVPSQSVQNHRLDTQHHVYKHPVVDSVGSLYTPKLPERIAVPIPHDSVRLPRVDYNVNRSSIDSRGYHYASPSTASTKYTPNSSVPIIPNASLPSRNTHRVGPSTPLAAVPVSAPPPPPPPPKPTYEYPTSNNIQTSPSRAQIKPGYANQQSRMTVSVTSLVNQMNQTKQKRESPLDLSVKTIKHSADSSTTQDEMVDSATADPKIISLQPRQTSSSRNAPIATTSYVSSHKVDFAPDFHSQYRERQNANYHAIHTTPVLPQPSVRYNGSYETPVRTHTTEPYPVDSRQSPLYVDRSKFNVHGSTKDYIQRIDLTRAVADDRNHERVRDDRHIIVQDRKRSGGSIVNNIPEKIVRYEARSSDSRIDRINRSAREQQELMSRPVYSYNHQRLEMYQNEQRSQATVSSYRDIQPHTNHRYPYPSEPATRHQNEYHGHYAEKSATNNSRHVIQKVHRDNHNRDISSHHHQHHHHHHHHHTDRHNSVPADKRVLSILRNSLETKQGLEPSKPSKLMPELIVIDDVDDAVIEITDLTKENDMEISKLTPRHNINNVSPNVSHCIQMPKAIDSIVREADENLVIKSKSPQNDVSSRIRTKAELKVMPPSQEGLRPEARMYNNTGDQDKMKILPKSQKQHLFNQIREDNLRLESVIKTEQPHFDLPVVKSEPMSIEEIEKDAEILIKMEDCLTNIMVPVSETVRNFESVTTEDDLDWASACDNFMEQLKTGCHKKKTKRKRQDTEMDIKTENVLNTSSESVENIEKPHNEENTINKENAINKENSINEENSIIKENTINMENTMNILPEIVTTNTQGSLTLPPVVIKQEPDDEDDQFLSESKSQNLSQEINESNKDEQSENKEMKNCEKKAEKSLKVKSSSKSKEIIKSEKSKPALVEIKKENEPIKTVIKEENESTDDDEPLIKSKLLKEKEESDRLKYRLLKDLSEKSAYVKLECFDVELNKSNRPSIDSAEKEIPQKSIKVTRNTSKSKNQSVSSDVKTEKLNDDSSSSDSDSDELIVSSRLRTRKSTKTEEIKSPTKPTPNKKQESSSSRSKTLRKPGFGDGSDFHPGWEEELYRFKRSLRMPTRLIAIPRGRSGGPFPRGSGALFTRGSTSLPDLDPAPLSPAPSSAPSAATDDLFARRQDKLTLDSDLDSNSSYSAPNRLHYDSEASTSTVFSSTIIKKGSSIVDVLIKKCGRKDEGKKKSKDNKNKIEQSPKLIPKNSNELLPTPSLGLVKNGAKDSLNLKREKILEDIFYLGAFRKEAVAAYRNDFITGTDGVIGATEEFAPVVLKTRTRTESRVLKQRATIKEVFGDDRPASAPPTSCRNDENDEEESIIVKKEPGTKCKPKPKKMLKDKLKRRSSSIRDGLRSTKSLKRNDAKGRLLRLKKRNNLIKSLSNKRLRDFTSNKAKKERSPTSENNDKDTSKEEVSATTTDVTKKRFKRLFGRRKFSSGFDYIRKKKKIIRREEGIVKKVRRPAVKSNPESVHDIHKEIKSWFVNKSIGETPLHRAARLGYTDCVAYCLEKMNADPSAKDNAGFTPLHVAAAKGHVRIGRLLLQYGANISAAAQGGIRPLHEASENNHVEMIRLLLSYGADPILGTYASQTPMELAEGAAARLLRLHIADVQGHAVEPWIFPSPAQIIDYEELGCDPLASPPPESPPPPPDAMHEIQCTDAPLPPFYSLKPAPGQQAEGLWCLLQDITTLLQIKSKESLLKQIHCGSGSPKELLREIRTQEFLERAQCHQLLCAGEKVNVRASKVALVRVTDKLRQLLKIETVLVS